MSVWDHIYTGDLKTIIDSMAEDENKADLCMAMEICKRIDLLEQCLMLPGFRKFAEEEYDSYLFSYFADIAIKLKKSKYPDIFKQWENILQGWYTIGIFGVNYPSCTAQRLNLPGEYVSIHGDGLFLFHFKIESLEKQQFAFGSTNFQESQESVIFRAYANCEIGDALTGQQITDTLRLMYKPPF